MCRSEVNLVHVLPLLAPEVMKCCELVTCCATRLLALSPQLMMTCNGPDRNGHHDEMRIANPLAAPQHQQQDEADEQDEQDEREQRQQDEEEPVSTCVLLHQPQSLKCCDRRLTLPDLFAFSNAHPHAHPQSDTVPDDAGAAHVGPAAPSDHTQQRRLQPVEIRMTEWPCVHSAHSTSAISGRQLQMQMQTQHKNNRIACSLSSTATHSLPALASASQLHPLRDLDDSITNVELVDDWEPLILVSASSGVVVLPDGLETAPQKRLSDQSCPQQHGDKADERGASQWISHSAPGTPHLSGFPGRAVRHPADGRGQSQSTHVLNESGAYHYPAINRMDRIHPRHGSAGRDTAAAAAAVKTSGSSPVGSSAPVGTSPVDVVGVSRPLGSVSFGPRFKLLSEGDIQLCRLTHSGTVISKILSSKYLRRWETHHIFLNDAWLSSKTVTIQPITLSSK